MNPFLSVIIPIYNGERYLEDTVKSVLSQPTSGMFEILLINDGSTDNTESICEKFNKENANITYIHKDNSGVSDTRNCGIKEAKGKYIAFLDADDVWSENVFSTDVIDRILKNKPDIVAFGMNNCTHDITQNISTILPEDCCVRLKDSAVDGLHVHFCSIIYKKSFLFDNDLRFDKTIRYFEDGLFRTKAQYLAKSVMKFDEVLLNYRNNPVSVMHTSKQKEFAGDYYTVYMELYAFFDEQYRNENRKFYVNSNLGQRAVKSAYYLSEFEGSYKLWYEKFFSNNVLYLFNEELNNGIVSAPEDAKKLIIEIMNGPKKFYYKYRIIQKMIEIRRIVYRRIVKVIKVR